MSEEAGGGAGEGKWRQEVDGKLIAGCGVGGANEARSGAGGRGWRLKQVKTLCLIDDWEKARQQSPSGPSGMEP